METYVYSLHTRAPARSHREHGRSGVRHGVHRRVPRDDHVPAGPLVCTRCALTAGHPAIADDGAPDTAALDAAVIAVLLRGLDNPGVARELCVGLRTAVRAINGAQRRAGARSRFQFGYVVAGGTLDR